jgi:hypothetical protein
MPEQTANINIEYEGISDDIKSDVKDVITAEFNILADYENYLNTKAFERNKSNTELVDETIETLKSEVDANMEVKEWVNKDRKSHIDYIYKIYFR